jgi:hypothetical protein
MRQSKRKVDYCGSIKMAKENNGMVTTAMVVETGFSRGNIKYLVDKGMIKKSARGVILLIFCQYNFV